MRYEKYLLSSFFDISTTKSVDKNKLNMSQDGEYDFVGRTSVNWGIQGYLEKLDFDPNPKHCFSLVQIGETIALWRENEWYASQNIFILKPKFDGIKENFLYFQGVINKEMTTYGSEYNSYPTMKSLEVTYIILPTLDDLDENSPYSDEGFVPDFEYMKKCIAELEELRVAELAAYLEGTGLSDYILTEQEETILTAEPEMAEFSIGDLFELTGVKQAKSQKLIPTKEDGIPYVVQSQMNNMVSRRVDKQYLIDNDEPICEGNVIVLGVTLPVVSYQPTEFGASQVITAYNKHLNEEVGLFLAAQLQQHMVRFSYSNKPGISKYKQLMLKLPIQTDEDNNPIIDPDKTYHKDGYIPDWDFMEKYIKAIEKIVIADVVKYKDEVIETTKRLLDRLQPSLSIEKG